MYAPWPNWFVNANRDTLSFRPFGQMSVAATFSFCDEGELNSAGAAIISQTGRPGYRTAARPTLPSTAFSQTSQPLVGAREPLVGCCHGRVEPHLSSILP